MLKYFYPVRLQHSVDKQPLHPLHVGVSVERIKNSILIEVGSQFNGVLSNFYDGPLRRNIFVNVHAVEVNSDDTEGEDDEVLSFYVTKDFLSNYHFEYDQTLQFRYVLCTPITKVIFNASSERSYMWAKSSKWQKELLSSVHKSDVLCRLHDVFLANPQHFSSNDSTLFMDMRTIICEPVYQGILTSDTVVIIFNDYKTQKSSLQLQVQFPFTSSISDLEKTNKRIGSIHLTSLQNEASNFPGKDVKDESLQVNVILHMKIHFSETFCEFKDFNVIDPLSTVFVNANTLKHFGFESGTSVEIKLSSTNGHNLVGFKSVKEWKDKSRLVWFVCLPDDYGTSLRDMQAYISPNLWFNLNSHPSRLLQPLRTMQISSTGVTPCYAKEVFVSLVQSPCYHGAISCDSMLKKYFHTPRLVYKGDIICIDTKDAVEFKQKNMDMHTDNVASVVYFRISTIEGLPLSDAEEGYLIDDDHTRLYHAGTTQSYIPWVGDCFYSTCIDLPFYSSPSPLGLLNYTNALQDIVEPLLNMQSRKKYQVNSNIIIAGPSGCGKTVIVRALCRRLNLHLYQVNCHELLGDNSATIEARLKIIIEKASTYSPCILLLKNIDIIGKERELKGENSRVLTCSMELLRDVNKTKHEWPTIIIATTVHNKLISSNLLTAFLHVVNIDPPTEEERADLIGGLLYPSLFSEDVSFNFLSKRTAGFVLADLTHLVFEARKNCYVRAKEHIKFDEKVEDVILAGFPIVKQDFLRALDQMHQDHAKSSGAPQIPNVNWEDVGGLEDVKQQILDSIKLPLDYPEILSTGLRRSGVLLYGPPGSGKTLLAKAVASEFSLNFMSIKGPELINMYVGQSEENVRTVFAEARASSPCIIFFDELDSLAPRRGKSADSGGVMDRVVSQLLSEIDGLHTSAQVFVIGATNRPDLLDPALLRPGRFDRLVYVGVPNDKDSRLSVLRALTRKLNLSNDVDLNEIVDLCPTNMSGADFYSLCSDAVMNRIESNVKLIEKGEKKIEESSMTITKDDFIVSINKLLPSVNVDELSYYKTFMEKM